MTDTSWLESPDIQAAVALWDEIQMPQLQLLLDTETQTMVQRQETCDASRKNLVHATKSFKQTATEDVHKGARQILRLYQKEIDTLSKRSKAAELSYSQVYAKLSDAPDPSRVMLDIISQARAIKPASTSTETQLLIENEKLKAKLELYESEIMEVKNQELTVKKLRAEIKTLRESEGESQRDAVEAKTHEMMSTYNNELQDLQQENQMLQSSLATAHTELEAARIARQVAESSLFEQKSQLEDNITNLQAQMDFLVEDSDRRAQQMLENYKRDNPVSNMDPNTVADSELVHTLQKDKMRLEADATASHSEINRLINECQAMSQQLAQAKKTGKEQEKEFDSQIQELESEIERITDQLDAQNDYENVKKELDILRNYEFKEEMDHEKTQTVEELLLLKNKRLQKKAAETNALLSDKTNELTQQSETIERLQDEVSLKATLVAELETAVQQLQQTQLNGLTTVTVADTPLAPAATVDAEENSLEKDMMAWGEESTNDPVDTILNMQDESITESASDTGTAAASLLSIITSQRDRFKSRNEALESDTNRLKHELAQYSGEVASLKGDNLKLYEKIKFLQSYQGQKQGPSSADQTLDKYSQQYEDKLNPFQAFNENERSQRYTQLSTSEKAIFGLTRFITSNKTARSFVFFYAILLHLLVLGTLYAYSFASIPMDASACMADFQTHMLTHGHEHGGGEEMHAATIPKMIPNVGGDPAGVGGAVADHM